MAGRLGKLAMAATMALATLVIPMQAAYAADGCGDDYFKQSDGYLTKDAPYTGSGGRNAWIYHTGRVRFCTQDDPINNDENRRAVVGYPSDSYPFESEIRKNGTYTSFCVSQKLTIHLTGIKSSSGWSLGGSASKGGPGVDFSYSSSQDTVTVNVTKTNTLCDASARVLKARISNVIATAQDESGKVAWVRLITTITAKYKIGSTAYSDVFPLSEYDYS